MELNIKVRLTKFDIAKNLVDRIFWNKNYDEDLPFLHPPFKIFSDVIFFSPRYRKNQKPLFMVWKCYSILSRFILYI